ncbi:MAG: hypothetical protein HYX38_05025 [Rhodospirillales bacterium]|nr:hypothetical protein [Rhodospirillales bacterium]
MTAKRKNYQAVTCELIVTVGTQARADGRAPVELHWGPGRELRASRHKIPGHHSETGTFRGLQPIRTCAGRCPLQAGPGSGAGAPVPAERNAARSAASHPPYRLAQTSILEASASRRPHAPQSYLIDSQVLRTGSANFSASGLERQDNDLVVIRDARSIAQFAETFEGPWARPGNKVWRPER